MATTKAKTKAKAGTKTEEIAAIKKTEILASVGGLSLGGVADQLAKTQVEIQKKLADVSTQMSASLATLENVNAAIEAKKQELQTLHEIEATALTLDEIQGTIETTREQWAAEEAERERLAREAQGDLAKARKREEDEYAYKTVQERRKAKDEYEGLVAAQKKAEADRKELLERGYAAREAELKGRETELTDLRAAVAAFPAAMKKDTDAAVAIATNSLRKQLETEAALKAKDAEVALKIAQSEKGASVQEVSRLQAAITDLHRQLDGAHKAAQDVAVKALDSASGRGALETLQNSLTRSDAGTTASGRR